MITTVCMNPSFDKTASVDTLATGGLNRLRDVRVDVGGKGVNVAVVLKRLGVPVSCVGCLGERGRESFLQMIRQEGVPFDYLPMPGEVRTNLKLLDNSTRAITEFNEPGISMDSAQLEDFLTLLGEKAGESEYVVLSGRLPEGCAEATYQRCLKTLEGKKCVLDCAGETLLHGVKERPFLIKPNLPEIEGIMKKELRTLRGLRDAALFLIEYGAQNVIISMGKYGAMLVSRTDTFFAPALMVEARSTVGAGDAMIGGVLAGLSRGESLAESFRWGVAAGAASVMTDGTQLLRRPDFEALLPKVTVQEV
ncbi:MAG TPA: 1-phosphofructokinase family hexose kinase [Candidatus Limiplasma pullistercoris]|nr:1-phosphofructokinase family hexose kinase [Candidatus Limiplasma pullistercoris]